MNSEIEKKKNFYWKKKFVRGEKKCAISVSEGRVSVRKKKFVRGEKKCVIRVSEVEKYIINSFI